MRMGGCGWVTLESTDASPLNETPADHILSRSLTLNISYTFSLFEVFLAFRTMHIYNGYC